MEYKVTLKKWQDEFIFSKARYPGLIASWGTGKTMSAIIRCLNLSQQYPHNLGVIIRKNYTDLADSTMRDFQRYTGIRVMFQRKEARLPNKSTILFRHGDEVSVLQNVNLGWFFIEQAEEFPDSTTFDFLCGRLRRTDSVGFRSGCITANANGHNWVWNMWINGNNPEYPGWQAKTSDMSDVLPADYIKSLEELKIRNPDLYKRCVLNDHEAVSGGQFFDTWNEGTHKIKPFPIPSDWERVISIDYGYGAGASSVGFWAIDYNGKVYRYRELYEYKKTYSELAYLILSKCPGETITTAIADPAIWGDRSHHKDAIGESGGETMSAILYPSESDKDIWIERRRRGISDKILISLQKGDNNRIIGWGRFREYLAVKKDQHGEDTPGMYVFDTCRDFIRTVPLMIKNKTRPEDLDTTLEDHIADETRLFLMSRPIAPTMIIPERRLTRDEEIWKNLDKIRKGVKQRSNYDMDYLGSEG
jgi:hypothetical protein